MTPANNHDHDRNRYDADDRDRTRRDGKKDVSATKTGATGEPETASQEGLALSDDLSAPDMNRDPAAGSMMQDSFQADTIGQSSAPDDTGLPAREQSEGTRDSDVAGDHGAPVGAVHANGTVTCPADYPVKAHQGSKRYHMPGRATYHDLVPDWCFATELDAINAGYTATDDDDNP